MKECPILNFGEWWKDSVSEESVLINPGPVLVSAPTPNTSVVEQAGPTARSDLAADCIE